MERKDELIGLKVTATQLKKLQKLADTFTNGNIQDYIRWKLFPDELTENIRKFEEMVRNE